MEPPREPGRARTLVHTIVCAYTRDELPAAWIQVFRRFERAVARARLRIRVRLLPLDAIAPDVSVVVAPPELEARAREAAPGAVLVVTTRAGAVEAVGTLLREIAEGVRLYAEPADPDRPLVIRRRGSDIL